MNWFCVRCEKKWKTQKYSDLTARLWESVIRSPRIPTDKRSTECQGPSISPSSQECGFCLNQIKVFRSFAPRCTAHSSVNRTLLQDSKVGKVIR